jgi:DNA-binding IclR family transcriptional regulator
MRRGRRPSAQPGSPESIAGTKGVRDALRMLDLLAESGRRNAPCTFDQLAAIVGTGKSSIHRLIAVLRIEGWLAEVGSSIRLGPKAIIFAAAVLAGSDLRSIVRPFLEELRDQTNESVLVGVLNGHEVVYVERIDSHHPVRFAEGIGVRRPLHSTAAGKAILSSMDPLRARALLLSAGTPALTRRTKTTVDDVMQEVELARVRGYATSIEEHTEGVSGVASPIRGGYEADYAAIVLAGPAERINPRVEEFGRMVHNVARSACAALEGLFPAEY